MTLNDLERPIRTLVQKRCVFWSFGAYCTNLYEDRPILNDTISDKNVSNDS